MILGVPLGRSSEQHEMTDIAAIISIFEHVSVHCSRGEIAVSYLMCSFLSLRLLENQVAAGIGGSENLPSLPDC